MKIEGGRLGLERMRGMPSRERETRGWGVTRDKAERQKVRGSEHHTNPGRSLSSIRRARETN